MGRKKKCNITQKEVYEFNQLKKGYLTVMWLIIIAIFVSTQVIYVKHYTTMEQFEITKIIEVDEECFFTYDMCPVYDYKLHMSPIKYVLITILMWIMYTLGATIVAFFVSRIMTWGYYD